ncbi:MAG: flagellar filament capping protein FliD [Anaerofustis sp.]
MVYSVGSYSSLTNSKAVFGLASGLDTESLIKSMTTGTRSKIAVQLQNKQLALWKQNDYRTISSAMIEFQKKYLGSSSSSDSILSSKYFDVSTINNTSNYVKISGDSDVAQNLVIRDITQLATKTGFTASVASDTTVTTGAIQDSWDLNYLQGAKFSLNYGGTDYSLAMSSDFSFSDTSTTDGQKLDDVITELNAQISSDSALNGKVQFSKVDDGNGGYTVALTDLSGNNETITVNDDGSSILLGGLGITAGQTSSTGALTGESSANVSAMYEEKTLSGVLSGTTLTLSLNGESKTITFDADQTDQYNTAAKLADYLQSALDDAYGDGKISATLNSDNKLVFQPADASSIFKVVSASTSTVLGTGGALHVKAGETNRLELTKTLADISSEFTTPLTTNSDGKYEISVNGTAFTFESTALFGDVMSRINNSTAGVKISYISTTNTFSVSAKDYGSSGAVDIKDSNGSNLSTALFGTDYTINQAQDAKLEVSFDGGSSYQAITRSSNSFTLDGVTLQLLGKADGDTQENISFSVSTDADSFYKKISDFVTDYNSMITLITNKLTETQSTDEQYLPLTDEQKEDMSDDEITNWETEAKKGLLKNDSYLQNIITDLRSSMNTVVKGLDTTLSSIGISTKAYDWESNGTLEINEDTLKAAISEDPEAIKNLFLQQPTDDKDTTTMGLSYRLKNIFTKYVNTLGTDGILVNLAGVENDNSDDNNTYSDKIDEINDNLSDLQDQLETEESRYVSKFTSLETYISTMNSQSSYLSSLLGTSSSSSS